MKYLSSNTLAHYNAAPQVHRHDLSALQTAVFSASTTEYRKQCGQTSPNDDAVSFYTLNHCASIVRKLFTENEPLPDWAQQIMGLYTNVLMAQGERLLHYLLCITTRETRHLKTSPEAFWKTVESQWDLKSVTLLKSISSNGDEMLAVKKYQDTPPDVAIGQYVKTLAYGFHHGTYNSGYGGKPWGYTTDALVAMIHGETSMEMLVDTGYTLAHNGGPIFDKGMMYSHYNSHLLTVLDVQRSGQMLDLMLESNTQGITKTSDATFAVSLVQAHRPEEFKGYVDWKLVDELRPAKDKAAHPAKYAKATTAQKQPKAKTVKPSKPTAPEMTTLLGKKAKITGTWQVFPQQVVKIMERVEN